MDIDPKRLQQVTLNLLTNAMKFTMAGGKVQLGGSIVVRNEGGVNNKYVEIYVKDSGYGISKED